MRPEPSGLRQRAGHFPRQQLLRQSPALLLLILLFSLPDAAALTFTLAPYDDECFLMHTPKNADLKLFVSGSFEMLDAGSEGLSTEPILFYLMDGTTDEIKYQSKPGTGRGNFRVRVQPSQKYWLCVQNNSRGPEDEDAEHPDHRPRTVGLKYYLDMSATPQVDPLDPHNQKLETWMQSSAEVLGELTGLNDHFAYMKTREAEQRETMESTFTATMTWTVFEAAMVCVVAIGQVFYLRSFLEKKRYM